jgi:uncharacterized NAD-dependent epimerase/dehydratase family protein
MILLTEGMSNPAEAKTATGLLRYRGEEVAAVYDSACAGRTAGEVLGVGGTIPFVDSLDGLEADTLVMGIATAGGELPGNWRAIISDALRGGMKILNGLHTFIAEDPELASLAAEHGGELIDVRRPPADLVVSSNEACNTACFRVHTVGHDCGVGKMLTALELTAALRERGHTAEFLATGQTGIMISGAGIPIDAVVSDFIAGAAEQLVLENRDKDFVLIEGQGSLVHPLYSGVTLGLLHGCAPQAMVMGFDPTRTTIRHSEQEMPPLKKVIELYESMAKVMSPSRVVAVAANTSSLDEGAAQKLLAVLRDNLGLPAADVVRFSCEPIVDAVLEERRRLSEGSSEGG